MGPIVNHLVVLIVPPLPALLIILFLLIIKKVLIKLFWTLIGVVKVFSTLILTGLAQDVFMFLKERSTKFLTENDTWKGKLKIKIELKPGVQVEGNPPAVECNHHQPPHPLPQQTEDTNCDIDFFVYVSTVSTCLPWCAQHDGGNRGEL